MFLTHLRALRAPTKCRVAQKPGNSSVLYRKTKNPFEPKICLYKGFKVRVPVSHDSRNSEEAIVS